MSSGRTRFLPEAAAEVEAAFLWYLERSARAAENFAREIDRATRIVGEAPGLWPAFELDTRKYVLHGYPFSLIYRVTGDEILVVSVAHHSRRPGYWSDR